MAKPKVGVRGGPELARALAKLDKAMRDDALRGAMQQAADVIAIAWREAVPKDEHNYERAIKAKAKAGKRGATAIVGVYNVPGVPRNQQPRYYAMRLEVGGLGMAVQPSLRPAFDASKERAVVVMGGVLRYMIAKAT